MIKTDPDAAAQKRRDEQMRFIQQKQRENNNQKQQAPFRLHVNPLSIQTNKIEQNKQQNFSQQNQFNNQSRQGSAFMQQPIYSQQNSYPIKIYPPQFYPINQMANQQYNITNNRMTSPQQYTTITTYFPLQQNQQPQPLEENNFPQQRQNYLQQNQFNNQSRQGSAFMQQKFVNIKESQPSNTVNWTQKNNIFQKPNNYQESQEKKYSIPPLNLNNIISTPKFPNHNQAELRHPYDNDDDIISSAEDEFFTVRGFSSSGEHGDSSNDDHNHKQTVYYQQSYQDNIQQKINNARWQEFEEYKPKIQQYKINPL